MRLLPAVTSLLILATAAAVGLTLSGCEEKKPEPKAPTVLRHDFGTIRHGHIVDHVFTVPVPAWEHELVPKQWIGNCDCVTGLLMIRDQAGWSRPLAAAGQDPTVYRVLPGETLLLRLTFDTNRREATDHPPKTYHGDVYFTPLMGAPVAIPPLHVEFRCAIQAPVRIGPVARMDFGRLPVSAKPARQTFRLHKNLEGFDIRFGKLETTPNVHATLDQSKEPAELTVEVRPDAKLLLRAVGRSSAAFIGAVKIETNIPGQNKNDLPYTLMLPVSGEISPAIEALGPGVLSFGYFDFSKKQDAFVVVADHHPSAGQLVVQTIRNSNGQDIREHFQIQTTRQENSRLRLDLTYLGKLRSRSFQGELLLARSIDGEPVCRIKITGFNANP